MNTPYLATSKRFIGSNPFLILTLCLLTLFGCGKNGSVDCSQNKENVISNNCDTCTTEISTQSDTDKIISHLKSKNFKCDFYTASDARGPRCQGSIKDYPQPINIFIAPHFNATAPLTIAYHFHGWWTGGASPVTGTEGDYGKFIAESGKNTILVIPESTGKNTIYRSVFTTAAKTTSFLNHVDELLNGAGDIVNANTARTISGHSAASVTLASIGTWVSAGSIPPFDNLIGVALLDTAYSYNDGLVAYMKGICANNPATYYISYNPNDGSSSKKAANEKIYKNIQAAKNCGQAQLIYTPDKATSHVNFPKNHYSEFLKAAAL
jgi:hypothetical protein